MTSSSQIWKKVTGTSSFMVAGVAQAPPEAIFSFLSSPRNHPGVIESIESVQELAREEHAPGLVKEVLYTMTASASLFGRKFPTSMQIKLTACPISMEINFWLTEGTTLISRMEGVNLVIPLPDDLPPDAALDGLLAKAVEGFLQRQGQDASGRLAVQQEPPVPTADPSPRQPQRCIVIMHQMLKPRFAPPPIARLLRGHMLENNAKTLADVLGHFERIAQ